MSMRSDYKTQQRKILLSYLRTHAGKHMTVDDLLSELRKDGHTIGQTTVYRNLNKLVENGTVRRYTISSIDSACYEYIPDESVETSFHLQCEECGELTHFQCKAMGEIHQHMYEGHSFLINPSKTVFYGKCPGCLNRSK